MQMLTNHAPVAVTERNGREQGRQSSGGKETQRAAAESALDLRPEKALVVWYRLGLTVPNLRPPERWAYAYRLGRRIAALRRPE